MSVPVYSRASNLMGMDWPCRGEVAGQVRECTRLGTWYSSTVMEQGMQHWQQTEDAHPS